VTCSRWLNAWATLGLPRIMALAASDQTVAVYLHGLLVPAARATAVMALSTQTQKFHLRWSPWVGFSTCC
jgi:hypothetical protein